MFSSTFGFAKVLNIAVLKSFSEKSNESIDIDTVKK